MEHSSRRFRTWWLVLILCVGAAAASPLFALTDEEIFRDFRFNLSNPGARSLGLGGAFIAVADDATASLANPAGLMLLARPEFFTEIRYSNVDSSSIEQNLGGSASITSSTEPMKSLSPSFLSYVHPFKRFALGFSRVELINTSNVTSNQFALPFDPNNPSILFLLGGSGRIETTVSVWNLSGAVKLLDKLSLGATATFGFIDMRAGVSNVFTNTDPNDPVYNIPQTLYDTSIDDTDTDVSFNVGLHWRPFNKISFGAVYRGGLRFELEEKIFNDGFFGGGISAGMGSPLSTTLNTPDSYGAGVSYRPLNALTLSLDWVHIMYTDILDGFQGGLNVLTLFDPEAKFTVEDADEWHFGAEYVFSAGTIPWAARAGAYSDHNSRIYADFANGFSSFSTNDSFPPRDTVTHYTIGTGVVVKERFQIDAAADISEIANEFVLSTIFRF